MNAYLDDEFINAYTEVRGYSIPLVGLAEISKFYPNKYDGNLTVASFNKRDELSSSASKDYLIIIRAYLKFYHIPLIIESITAAYDWGIDRVIEKGIYKAPKEVKALMGYMRHTLEPQANDLDEQIK